MYQTYWGLQESPFRGILDPKFYYQSSTHEEAMARLQFLVQQRRRLGLLVGPSGSGKSMLLEVFAAELRRNAQPVAKLSLLGIEPAEALWLLASQWGINVDPTRTAAVLWRAVTDRLIAHRYQRLDSVVMLDDVDRADAQVMQNVLRLVNFDPLPESRLTVVLAGRNEGMARLDPRLLDLAELRIEVEPWEPSDTGGYVSTVLAQAGRNAPVFAEPAVARLHELSHGVPRRVSQLADLALVAGAGANLQQIDANVVESVYQELATY